MSESQKTDISKKEAYDLLDAFVEQLKEYVLYEDMHIYNQEVELNTDNYGSELTVSLEGEKIDIDYIDFEMYVREALPEYFQEATSEEE
jgi:hypothetical protein